MANLDPPFRSQHEAGNDHDAADLNQHGADHDLDPPFRSQHGAGNDHDAMDLNQHGADHDLDPPFPKSLMLAVSKSDKLLIRKGDWATDCADFTD